MMPEYFCVNCGTASKNNSINDKTGDVTTTCKDCEIVFRFYIVSAPKKTLTEASNSFNKTSLTDRQETGRANTGKYKRQRKRKK